jgi:hypothetical protein
MNALTLTSASMTQAHFVISYKSFHAVDAVTGLVCYSHNWFDTSDAEAIYVHRCFIA